MVYVHTILRDVGGLFKVGRLVAYKFPDWFQKCDRILSHPLSSERHDLIDAMASAPDFFLKGILYGAYFSSLEIEQVTGRAV